MSYSSSIFLKPIRETDKTIRVFDNRGVSTHAINPFSVLRIIANGSNLNISLTGNKSIILNFSSMIDTREALVKLQSYIDLLKKKVPVLVDQETERFVDDAIIQASERSVNVINGLTASYQKILAEGDSIIKAEIESKLDTHNITVSLTGLIPFENGGTNNTEGYSQNELLISDGEKLASSGYSVSSGKSSKDLWSASQIISVISSITSKEVVSGEIDGSNRTFNIAKVPVTGSEHVFLNGILQMEGEYNDYTIQESTILFTEAPVSGMKIICSYCIDYTIEEAFQDEQSQN